MAAAAAQTMCTFGAAPSTLMVLATNRVMVEGRPAANALDHQPMVNIVPFGMCSSLANPTVAAATAAALGVLTPMPCVPVTPAPWFNTASATLVASLPVVTMGSQCQCAWGGVVKVINAGSTRSVAG